MNAQLKPALLGEILLDVPAAEYQRRELGVATSGVLKRLREETPAHHKAWVSGQDDETPAKAFGRAYHCRVFEPEIFARTYCVPPIDPPRRPTKAQRDAKEKSEAALVSIGFWDEWDANHAGMIQLPPEAFGKIEEMHAALLASDPMIVTLLFREEGDNEVTLRWTDESTGVPCKARADRWLRRLRIMLDLKSAESIDETAFRKTVSNYGYHIQHSHYSAGAAACGEPLDEYLIVAQEKEAPYLARIFRIDAEAEARGFELRERGLTTLETCRKTGVYPGYAGITELSLAPWALKD